MLSAAKGCCYTAAGDSFNVITITEANNIHVFLKELTSSNSGGSVVFDCRPLAHEQCVQNVEAVSELLSDPTVLQVWFGRGRKDNNGSFLEIKGRLRKCLRKDAGKTEKEYDKVIAKVRLYMCILYIYIWHFKSRSK